MFHLENEKSAIYHKGLLVNKLVNAISIILTMATDDSYLEPLFKRLWILSLSAWGIIEGMKMVIAKQNIAGYLYFIGAFMFLLDIICIYTNVG